MLGFILKLMVFQAVSVHVVSWVRDASLKHSIKEKGYKVKKFPLGVQISRLLKSKIQSLVPIYGFLMLIIVLFVSDEEMIKEGIKIGLIVKEE